MATCAISATEANVIPAAGVKGRDDSQIKLVKRAQSGDEQAFATLFQQHKNRAAPTLRRRRLAERQHVLPHQPLP